MWTLPLSTACQIPPAYVLSCDTYHHHLYSLHAFYPVTSISVLQWTYIYSYINLLR